MSQNFQIENNNEELQKKLIEDNDSMKTISHVSLNKEDSSVTESKEEKVKVIHGNDSSQNIHENSKDIINSRKSSSFNLEDLKNDIADMRNEMKDDFSSLKNEISKVASLLNELLKQLKVGNSFVKKEEELKR